MIIWNLISYDFDKLVILNNPSLYDLTNTGILNPLDARLNWLYIQNYLLIHTPKSVKNTYLFDLLISRLAYIKVLNHQPNLPKEKLLSWAVLKLSTEISDLKNLLDKKGISLIITRLPIAEDIGLSDSNADRNHFFNTLETYLRKEKIFYIDIVNSSEFKDSYTYNENSSINILGIQHFNPGNLFFEFDKHLNNNGANFIAKVVKRYLQQEFNL